MQSPEESNKPENSQIQIWTIGHSTRTIEEFINILKAYNIEVLVDVRSYPGSKRFPHFNKNTLDITLAAYSIEYLHIPELGGMKKPSPNSNGSNSGSSSFRGYADYMETESYRKGINLLNKISLAKQTAIMCAEALWWKCHRSLIADYLVREGFGVVHIFDEAKSEVHVLKTPSEEIQKELFGGENKNR